MPAGEGAEGEWGREEARLGREWPPNGGREGQKK
jgi:hypothetical protein